MRATRWIDPLEAVEQELSRGMAVVGQRFENGEAYLHALGLVQELLGLKK